ncbi:hypothetical protein [Pedobacter nototheniae]|uniref:hypothetical protein n=1 Tax=Pedobacter nototheniae TaxID=2488994 RepID=UPI00292F8220|nr:hypothetical protein [Pedobacter nototheniae]
MFIPYFIAILLGLINPSNTNHSGNCNGTTTVSAANTNPDDPGVPDDGSTPGPGPGTGTGGDTGQNPPPKIN